MRAWRMAFAVTCMVLATGAQEQAPKKPDTPQQAADKVLAAWRTKDAEAVKALAARDDPDPWVVADELCARGEHDAASAFAAAARRPDTAKLADYVASERQDPTDPAQREALVECNAALAAGDFEAALRDAAASRGNSVAATRLRRGRGLALRALGRQEESVQAFRAAADAGTARGWLAMAALALNECGSAASDRSDFRTAAGAFGTLVAVERERGNRPGEIWALLSASNAHRNLAEYPAALEYGEHALGLARELGYRLFQASAHLCVGETYRSRGEARTALARFEEAMRIYEDDGFPALAAMTSGSLGNACWSLGRYTESLAHHERALRAARELKDRKLEADALLNIGNVAWAIGEYRQALDQEAAALKLYDETGNRAGAALAAGNLGNIHWNLGEYAKALEHHERVLRDARELTNPALEADAHLNMGNVYTAIGEHRRTLECSGAALEIYDRLGNQARVGLALGNIGAARENLGEYTKALSCHERALALARETGDRTLEAMSLLNTATTEWRLGRNDDAAGHLQQALRIREDLGDRAGAALVLGYIGQVYETLGRYDEALGYRERALALARETGSRETEILNLMGLAKIRLAQGRPADAAARAREGVEGTLLLTSRFGEESGANARERWAELQETGLQAALRLDDPAEAAFFVESGRAGTLLESLGGRAALRDAALPEDLARDERAARIAIAEARARLGSELTGGERVAFREANAALRKAEGDLLAAVARIQRVAKATADVAYFQAASLAELRASLRRDEALVAYVLLPHEALALVITPGGARLAKLGKTSDLDGLAAKLAPEDDDSDFGTTAAGLRDALITPLALGTETRRLLVSPHGSLASVPFTLLAPGLEVVYVPSGTTYRFLLEDARGRGDGVLAVGDPAYGAAGGAPGSRAPARLEATGREARAVGDVVLLGPDATERGFADALSKRTRWRAVHLACHGFCDTERPMLSCLALAPGGGEDGFLSAADVFRMKVPADLVVLSACETARGKVYRAEGVVGLVRAFMFAGAPRIIGSLWKVDDEATQALMAKFYELWNPKGGAKGLPAATALRKAMESVRDRPEHPEWKHPRYWAAWQLWGLGE